MSEYRVPAWRRFPWVPAESVQISGDLSTGSLPLLRWGLLAGAAVCATLAHLVHGTDTETVPPWWVFTGAAAVIAVLAYFTRRYGVVPSGDGWLASQDGRVGSVETGFPHERSVTAVWLDPARTSVAQGLWARAMLVAAAGVITATGRDPALHGFPVGEDEASDEDFPDTTGAVVAWDGSGAFWMSGMREQPEVRDAVLSRLGAVPEPEPAGTLTPLVLRITRRDLRTLAWAGVATAAMLETVFAGHAPPDETDHALDLKLTRCWPSRIDGLSAAELHDLGPERILAALRVDLAAQAERDRAEPGYAHAVSAWLEQWTERLDAVARAEGLAVVAAPEPATADRPPLSTVASVALLLCASCSDRGLGPLRPELVGLGVPAEPRTASLPAGAPGWRVANSVVTVLALLVAGGALRALLG
ncbi:hypothetical protein [Allokutzneria oryzae]|uniref:Uncharacterized protein n=1 Tax=Allokutzneria oryzae TaxID=1378989 RepID=A0ABV5ZSG4_9PSEU